MNPSLFSAAKSARVRPSAQQNDALQQYLSAIHAFPILSPAEEQTLAVQALSNDPEATERLVQCNLRLVVKVALQFQSSRISLLDLIQEGNLGLLHAIKKFDASRKNRLASYAVWWIRAFILKFLMDNCHMVKIGTTQAQRRLFYNLKKTREQLQRDGLDPTPERIAAALQVRAQDVLDMDIRLSYGEASLDAPLNADQTSTLLDLIPTASVPSDQLCAQREIEGILSEKLKEFRSSLCGRDADIFEHRLLSDDPLTLQELGTAFGVSRERARQLDARVRNKLSKFFKKTMKMVAPFDADLPLSLE